MRKFITVLSLILILIMGGTVIYAADETAMVTEWTTTAANTTIYLPIQGGTNVTIDWGDGTTTTVNETLTTDTFPSHEYAGAGTHTVTITGTFDKWGYNAVSSVGSTSPYYTYTQYLTGVTQFGEMGATQYGFSGCTKLTSVTGATTNTFANVTSMGSMFSGCSGLTS